METAPPVETEAGFLSHLDELRRRVLYGVIALALGVVAGWFLYPYVYALLAGPIVQGVLAHGGRIVTLHPADAFMTQMRLAAVTGLALASPVIVWQLWLFVRPGLLPHEKRAIAPLMPAIGLLFLFGAYVAYLFFRPMMDFFLAFVPARVEAYIDFQQTVDLPLKLVLAFGITFQLPLLVLALVWMRVLTPATLTGQWRAAVFTIAAVAAIISPTADPLSMILLMVPLIVLYFATILAARVVVRWRRDAGDAGRQGTG